MWPAPDLAPGIARSKPNNGGDGAVNGGDVSAIVGILGTATCGADGDDGSYEASGQYGEDVLPVGSLGNVSNLVKVVGVQDALALTDNLPTGDVASLLGLGLLGGAGLNGATDTVRGTVDSATGQAAPALGAATQNAEASAITESSTVEAGAGGGDDTTVVAPHMKSESTSVAGDNSIASGNSLSVPIVAPVTGNDVAVAGIGGAVNAEDVDVVAGVLGVASALLD